MFTSSIALQIGPLKIHWYGLMYLCGFAMAWLLGCYRASRSQGVWTREQVSDVIYYGALGVIVGGRVGYMVFYALPELISAPWRLFYLWEGGMSFHGGLIGVMVALIVFARHQKKSFLNVTDFITPLVPLGLAFGRIGNFINGELWGRPTTLPWGVVFPFAGPEPRHPSQLYEAGLEGILLFLIVWWFSSKQRTSGAVTGLFLILYAIFRCFIELFRQPDPQYGYLAFGWVTMGMLLSIPMILVGAYLILRRKSHEAIS